MRAAFSERIQELPSFRRQVWRFRNCLLEGRSLVVALPEPHEQDDLWEEVQQQLHQRDLSTDSLNLDEFEVPHEPLRRLAEFVGLPDADRGRPPGIHDLLRSDIVPDILALRGLDNLCQEDQRRWMDLVMAWSQASQGLAGEVPRKSLFVPLSAQRLQIPVPGPDVRLQIDYWFGTPTTEELQHLARHDGSAPAPESLWREAMILAYASEDARLADELLTSNVSPPDWPSAVLEDYARARGWHDGKSPGELLHLVTRLRQRPPMPVGHQQVPAEARGPWSRGLLYWTPWHGWEIHSAWLAINGPKHLLHHRLWQAQTGLFLPLVDRLRLSICWWLSHNYGEDWPFRWTFPRASQELDKVDSDPFACQWGHLTRILGHPDLRPLRDLQQTAHLARDIRNALSHQDCIQLSAFRTLWKGYHDGLALLARSGGLAV